MGAHESEEEDVSIMTSNIGVLQVCLGVLCVEPVLSIQNSVVCGVPVTWQKTPPAWELTEREDGQQARGVEHGLVKRY